MSQLNGPTDRIAVLVRALIATAVIASIAVVIAPTSAVNAVPGNCTHRTVQNGNWSTSSTWLNGSFPSASNDIASSAVVCIHHVVQWPNGTTLKNRGTIHIEPQAGTTARLNFPNGVNIENYSTGSIVVRNASFTQFRFSDGLDGASGESQTKFGGTFKNIGGTVLVENGYLEVAQDWVNESGGRRTFRGSCLKAGQNYSLSGSSSRDVLENTGVSIGWHGSGNFQFSDGTIEFVTSQVQLAGTSGSFQLNSGSARGSINFITLKNHRTGSTGSGNITASSSVSTTPGLFLANYWANSAPTQSGKWNNGVQPSGWKTDLTSAYFPGNCSFASFTPAQADLSVDVTADSTGCFAPGAQRTFTVEVTNTSTSTTATGVVLTNPIPTGATFVSSTQVGYNAATGVWNVGTLAPSAVATLGITVSLSGSNTVTNVASATANQSDPDSTNNTASVAVEPCPPEEPGLEVTKVLSDAPEVIAEGSELSFVVTATNSGNVTLTGVVVSDVLLDPSEVTCGSVAPGGTCVLTGTYVVTQADVAAAEFVNVGSAVSDQTPVPVEDSVTVDLRAPLLVLTKSVLPVSVGAPGEVTFTFEVENAGNVTLTGVVVSDELDGLSPVVFVEASAGSLEGTLLPGEVATYTATYVVSQADVDAGSVVNVGSVSAPDPRDPDADPIVDEDAATVEIDREPGLEVTKTSDRETFSELGEMIGYTITVANSGNVTLTIVAVEDALADVGSVVCDGGLPQVLAPMGSFTCDATVTVTQAMSDAGEVVNTATASAVDPAGDELTDSANATVVRAPVPTTTTTTTTLPPETTTTTTTTTLPPETTTTTTTTTLPPETTTTTTTTTTTLPPETTTTTTLPPETTTTTTTLPPETTTTTTTLPPPTTTTTLPPTPAPPVADDDDAATPIGTPVEIDVLENDPSGASLTVTSVTQGANGSVELLADGRVRYTPNPGFVGVDTFTYTACDAAQQCVTRTVTVMVAGPVPAVEVEKTVVEGVPSSETCSGTSSLSVAAGSIVTYCFTVTNLGDTQLDDLVVDDRTLDIRQDEMTLVQGSLPLGPGDSVVYSLRWTVRDSFVNDVVVSASPVTCSPSCIPIPGMARVEDAGSARVTILEEGEAVLPGPEPGPQPGAVPTLPVAGSATWMLMALALALLGTGTVLCRIGRLRPTSRHGAV